MSSLQTILADLSALSERIYSSNDQESIQRLYHVFYPYASSLSGLVDALPRFALSDQSPLKAYMADSTASVDVWTTLFNARDGAYATLVYFVCANVLPTYLEKCVSALSIDTRISLRTFYLTILCLGDSIFNSLVANGARWPSFMHTAVAKCLARLIFLSWKSSDKEQEFVGSLLEFDPQVLQ